MKNNLNKFNWETLPELFFNESKTKLDKPLLWYKINNEFKPYSWGLIKKRMELLANNLLSLGIKKGLIVSHLEIPSQFFTKGNIKTAYLRGNKKASVVLIEFSDYHCPFCRKIQTTINKLIKNFGEKAKKQKKFIFAVIMNVLTRKRLIYTFKKICLLKLKL